ncbi:LamG-like jellyroll fold domain-containing protein [Nonomuraea terrae]|uniref:LamG-like jellyroll fold domain-containing protein n=1 Tax=Nonomuraea terrae TaxID=2530383 RepID=UPI003789E723
MRDTAAAGAAALMVLSLVAVPSRAEGSVATPAPVPAAATQKGGKPVIDKALEAARKKAKDTGKRVELPSHYSENIKVWANPDGKTLQAEVHTGPIHLKSPGDNGAWKPIDTTIVQKDGKITATRVKTPLEFGRAGSKTLVTATGEDGKAGLRTTGQLPVPRISGDAAVYTDAVTKGVDLVVHAEPNGFTQDVVLRERPKGALSIKLGMTLPKGMSYGATSDGRPQLKAADGKAAATPLAVQAMDARAEESPDTGRVGTVEATVENDADGPTLTLRPDSAFLTDPTVTYPVTVTLASEWIGAGLADDAWVNKNNPTLNHLTDGWLRAGTTATSADIARIYMRFVIGGPLAGAQINNADLMLWNYRSGAPAGSATNCGLEVGSGIVARKLSSSWNPALLSWNNQPDYTTEGQVGNKAAYSDTAGCSGGGELVHSIEQIVQSWADGYPDHGLVLMAASETTVINWRQYRSQEGGTHDREMPDHEPILFINYEPAQRIMVVSAYQGDPWTTAPSYEQAMQNQATAFRGFPTVTGLTQAQIADLKRDETAIPYGVDSSQLQPYPGEEWDPTENPYEFPEPPIPPTVIETSPVDGAADVPVDALVSATFGEPVTGAQITVKDTAGAAVAGTPTMDAAGTLLTFDPAQNLAQGTRYTVEVSGAQDPAGNTMLSHTWSFTTGGPDATAPSVTATTPGDGATGVAVGTTVQATFSEPVTGAQITLKDRDGAAVTGTAALDVAGRVLTYIPGVALAASTQYTATVSDAKDVAGNTMTPHTWSFTTAAPDTTPPAVTSSSPANDATDVPADTLVSATFGEPVTGAQIVVKDAAGGAVAGTQAMDTAGTVLTFDPAQPLTAGARYTVEVSGAKDSTGNLMAAPYTWSFTTGAKPPTGLVAAYGMNEGSGTGVADSSGNNNAGLATATSWQNGKYGKALSFNGTSSWVTVQDAVSLRLTTGMTLSAWVNPASVAGWSPVVSKELSADGVSYTMYAANGGSAPSGWVQTSPEDFSTVDSFEPLPVNTWSHLALTYDGTALRLFANGQQVAEIDQSGSLYDDGSPLRIGGNAIWEGEFFNGLIDEVRIYNRAQTAAEIQTDMTTPIGVTASPDTQAPTVPGSLAATGAPGNAQLTWTASTDNVSVDGYTIHRSTTPGFTPSAANQVGLSPTTTFTDAGLAAGTYYYRVRAFDAAGNLSPPSNEVSATVVTAPPATPGLVAAYGMEEGTGTSVGDSSGQNSTGAATDTEWATGKYGKALSFNGTSSWVTVQHAASLRLTNALTLSAWVRPTTSDDWHTVLMKEHADTWSGSYSLYSSDGDVAFGWLETTNGPRAVPADGPLPPNQWSHMAVTYDGSMGTLYVNGTQVDQTPISGNLIDDGSPLRLGGNSLWGEYFSGLIDEVRIYNRAQTAAQIQADMNTPVGAAATSATAQQQRMNAAADPAPAIDKLTVDGSRTVDGVTVSPSLTPRLTAWLSAGRDGEAKVEVEIADKPTKSVKTDKLSVDKQLIWSGQANAEPGDSRVTLQVPKGHLRDGENIRWRARVVTGQQTGPWLSWRPFSVDLSTKSVTTEPDKPATTTAVQPLASDPGEIRDMLPEQKANASRLTVGAADTVTPWFGAVLTDPAGRAAKLTVEVEHDPAASEQGTGVIWTRTAATATASGSKAAMAVPSGHLLDGWKIRWRVRADVEGTPGPWSDWQTFTVDESAEQERLRLGTKPAVKSPKVAKPSTSQATADDDPTTGTTPFRRRNVDWCRTNAIRIHPDGQWGEPNPYDYCYSTWVAYSLYRDSKAPNIPLLHEGTLNFQLTTVVQAHVGDRGGQRSLDNAYRRPRDIDMWVSIDMIVALDWALGVDLLDDITLELNAQTASESGHAASTCQLIEGSRHRLKSSLDYWEDNPTAYFRFYSDPASLSSENTDKATSCTLKPHLNVVAPDAELGVFLEHNDTVPAYAPYARHEGPLKGIVAACDTSPSITKYLGGCRFLLHRPIYIARRTTNNVEHGIASHIYTAFNTPGVTWPLKAGKWVPGNSEKPMNSNEGRELTREQFGINDRSFIQTPCHQLRVREGKVGNDDFECDEYPFNSTKERARYASGNYSLKLLPAEQNSSTASNHLWAFYERYRLLEQDPFWVKIE